MTDFDDLDDEKQKVRFLQDLLHPIAEQHGGRVRHDADEGTMYCRGTRGSRPFQLEMGTSTGGLRVELKIRNTKGLLTINHDPDAEPGDEPDEEWDEERRYFFAPTFYVEGRPAELTGEKAVLAARRSG